MLQIFTSQILITILMSNEYCCRCCKYTSDLTSTVSSLYSLGWNLLNWYKDIKAALLTLKIVSDNPRAGVNFKQKLEMCLDNWCTLDIYQAFHILAFISKLASNILL